MKIQFENVGNKKESFIAEYPVKVPLHATVDDYRWWRRQLRGKLLSSRIDICYNKEDDSVVIFGGIRVVGKARVAKDQGDVYANKV